MKTIKYIGFLTLLLAISSPAWAQRRRFDPARMVQMQTQRIFSNVKNLNKEQKDQIHKIFTQQADSMQKIFNNNSMDRQAKFQEMRQLRTSVDAQLKTVFTKEQYKQYEEMIAQMRERYRRRN